MSSWLGIPGEHITLFMLVGLPIAGGLVLGFFAILFEYIKNSRIVEAETRLKEAMIQQGRPTDEIERVIRASAYKGTEKSA